MPRQTVFLVASLTFSLLMGIASGGPDASPLPDCHSFIRSLSKKERINLRLVVQHVHVLSSQIALARISPSTTPSELAKLGQFLASNQTRAGHHLGAALRCLTQRLLPRAYYGRPTFSILLEYFKRPWGISAITSSLRAACTAAGVSCELVINVDNPHEAGAWAQQAEQEGGFLVPIFSSNIHEARGYNRAARAARGRYLIIWQDDQLPPEPSPHVSNETHWLSQLEALFVAWPQLALVGMNTYRMCRAAEPTNHFMPPPWKADPKTGVRWTFAQMVDFAPLVIRASTFWALGGLEESTSRPGDCGIWADWELSLRAWLSGWQVGFTYLHGRRGDGHKGGTHTNANSERCWGLQQYVASSFVNKRFDKGRIHGEHCEMVRRMNLEAFTLDQPEDCPYGKETLQYSSCNL